MEIKLPNLYIAGFRKCGTTTLCDWLGQHPDIAAPAPKEPNVFAFDDIDANNFTFHEARNRWWEADFDLNYENELKRYNKVFEKFTNESIRYDGTPTYINSLKALERIKTHTPNAKFIIMLRHPLKRAISDFKFSVRQRRASYPIKGHIKYENSTVLRDSFYLNYLKNLYRLFDKENILILTLEEMVSDPSKFKKEIATFLNIPPWNPIERKKNEGYSFYSYKFQYFLNRLPKLWCGKYNTINHYNDHLVEETENPVNKYLTKIVNQIGELNKTKRNINPHIPKEYKQQLNELFIRENRGLSMLTNKDFKEIWDINV